MEEPNILEILKIWRIREKAEDILWSRSEEGRKARIGKPRRARRVLSADATRELIRSEDPAHEAGRQSLPPNPFYV